MSRFKRNELWFFILLVFSLLVYFIYQNHLKNQVLDNYEKTYGEIYNYYIIGAEAANYLEYKYFVDEIQYTRKINIKSSRYEKCNENIDLCKGKRFWVIYSPDNPKNSLIDLTVEIQGLENPPFPKTLDDFE